MNNFSKIIIREIDLNLTNKCNLECMHCAFSSKSSSNEFLDFDKVCSVIEEAIEFGLEDVHLTGGEPTLYPDLAKLISFLNKKNINARLITNGISISEKRLSAFYSDGLKSIMYSIDGMEETHDKIRGLKGSFRRTVESIRQAKRIGFNIRVNAVISKVNESEIIDLISYLRKLDIDVFSFFLYSPTGRNAEDQLDIVPSAHEWKEIIDKIKSFISNNKITKPMIVSEKGYVWKGEDFNLDSYEGRGGGCYYLPKICDYLIILSNGDVYPCALLTDKNIRYGNIYERNLSDIVNNPENIDVYKRFSEPQEFCQSCKDWGLCHSSCKAFTYAYFSDWNKSDPRCRYHNNNNYEYFPLCPLHKENLITGALGGYSEKVVD